MTVRVARLTPPGTGAIATVAVVGADAWHLVRDLFRLANEAQLDDIPLPGSLHFGTFGSSVGDEVILANRPGTREPWLEIHCHGGREVVAWIIEQLTGRGATLVDWTDLERLQLQSWIRAAAAAELSRALTLKTAGILLAQHQGALERALGSIREMIDKGRIESAQSKLKQLIATGRVGLHLTQPFRIAIFGPPNVGKSSLINCIAGYERAVVSPIAGTTRELTTTLTAIRGWPIELYDSPGIRTTQDELESEGVRRGLAAIGERVFDFTIWLVDRTVSFAIPDDLAQAFDLIVVNKCDLPAVTATVSTPLPTIQVSALTGGGVPELLAKLSDHLVGEVLWDDGALFTKDLYEAASLALRCVEDGQLQRSQQVLAALLQPEKPQFSILANEPGNRGSDYAP